MALNKLLAGLKRALGKRLFAANQKSIEGTKNPKMLQILLHIWFGTVIVFLVSHIVVSLDDSTSSILAGLNESCENTTCLPGLQCNKNYICKVESGTCMSYQWSDDLWKPSCDEDGTWSAVQCKGEKLHGRCFCYNANGSRIFGWSWWHSAENMTCACSRRRDKLKNQGRKNVTLHCSEDGNYEKLQCDSGLCWCVDPQTGDPTERAYPESMMTHLSCYDEDKIGSQYLRLCESMHIARLEVIDKLERHGRLYAHIDTVNCDGDGSYAHYSLNGSIVYCLWKNGMRIDLYQTPVSSILTVNCNCARDSYIYSQANLTFSLQCQTNGNYQPEQTSNGYPFCVDSDGYATTTLGSFGETLECKES